MFRLIRVLFCFIVFLSLSSMVFALEDGRTPNFIFTVLDENGQTLNGLVRFEDVEVGDTINGFLYAELVDDVVADFNFDISFADSSNNDLSGWFDFPEDLMSFKLEYEGDFVEVPFAINVPENVLFEDYLGALYMNLEGYNDIGDSAGGSTIAVRASVGKKFTLEFADMDAEYKIIVNDFKILNEKSFIDVKMNFTNNGNVIVSPSLDVTAKNLKGEVVYSDSIQGGSIFPNQINVLSSLQVPLKTSSYFPWLDLDFDLYYVTKDDVRVSLMQGETKVSGYIFHITLSVVFFMILVIFVYYRKKI